MHMSDVQWRKSSRSAHQGGECVEVADLAPRVAVRDSKDPDGKNTSAGHLAFSRVALATLVGQIKSGELGL